MGYEVRVCLREVVVATGDEEGRAEALRFLLRRHLREVCKEVFGIELVEVGYGEEGSSSLDSGDDNGVRGATRTAGKRDTAGSP